MMPLTKGDFILVDYTAKVKETGEVFDTTLEEVSKREHLGKEGELYEPKLIVVGEGWVLKPLDEAFINMEPGKPSVVEIAPDKAFGPRDAEKVRRVPLKALLAKEINPTIGARVEYGGKMATVRSVGAGRVVLDFNPPLAGKTLVYDVTVQKKLEAREEKASSLIHRRIPVAEAAKFALTFADKTLTVDMPEEAFYVEGVQVAKRGISLDIQKYFPELECVKFVETFKVEPKPEAKPAT
jgi:FKBP-type peptidyl-prolyl cis-trans isomerase SlyD